MVWCGTASLTLLSLTVYTRKTILSIVLNHCWTQWVVVSITDILLFSLYELKLSLALHTRYDVALLPHNLIVEIIESFLSNKLCYGSLMEHWFAVLEETLQTAILIDKFLGNILDCTRFTEKMPAILHVEETLNIKVRIKLLPALKTLHNIGVNDR